MAKHRRAKDHRYRVEGNKDLMQEITLGVVSDPVTCQGAKETSHLNLPEENKNETEVHVTY